MKISGLVFLLLCVVSAIWAQQDPVLMRINGKDILRSEFEYAYNKNNMISGTLRKNLNEYADLFVNFKLKVAAAETFGIDTTFDFRKNIGEYRNRLVKSYLTDDAMTETIARQIYENMKINRNSEQIRVQQIYMKLPQNISGYSLRTAQARMDSIYDVLVNKGATADFGRLIQLFSDDKKSFWVSSLQMPIEFEEAISILQPNEISRPFFTPQGIHIVKVLEKRDVLPFEEVRDGIIRRQTYSYDMDKGTKNQVEKLKKEYNYTPNKTGIDELLQKGSTDKVLFTLDHRAYTGKEFARFAAAFREGIHRQLDGYVMKSVLDYENSRLEEKFPEFGLLIQEYREKMLLAEMSNREIWKRAQSDTIGLKMYFKEHRSAYNWETPRYKGIVLQCSTKKIAKQVRKLLNSLPEAEWKDAIRLTFNANAQSQVKAVQGLFSPGDNPLIDELVFKKGKAEMSVSYPFTALLGEKKKGPESYEEVGEALIIDYQNYLDTRWVKQLRSVAKVEINQEVLKTVNNH